jgi:hypothetical protein
LGQNINYKPLLSVLNQIENQLIKLGKNTIVFPSDFSSTSNTEAVKKALLRLEQKEKLVRLAHGIYLYPKKDKELGVLYPSVEEIAAAIAKRDKARIIPTGVQALNKLGLSTQVPMNVVFLTDGAPRSIRIGKRTIKFKKTTPKNLACKSEVCGLVIQALREIGSENFTQEQLEKIKQVLKNEKTELLAHDARLAPAWIAKIILSVIPNK